MESTFGFDLKKLTLIVAVTIVVTTSLRSRHGSSFVAATPVDEQGASTSGKKQVVRITTIEEMPYVFKERNSTSPTNEDFNGFIPELLKQLATKLKFDYTITLVADRKYGRKIPTGEWSGMIGEVVNGTADMAAAPITVSEDRGKVVDFTRPFMNFDSAILMKKSADAGIAKIASLEDLANQNVANYGVIRDGFTESYFRHAPNSKPVFQRMWQHMSSADTGVPDANEGIRRVRASYNGRPFAFITEGSTADYWVNQPPCNLVSVPVNMAPRSYALAVKKNWSMREEIDTALNGMEQSGELRKLRDKWWMTDACSSSSSSSRLMGGGAVVAAGVQMSLQLLTVIVVVALPTSVVG